MKKLFLTFTLSGVWRNFVDLGFNYINTLTYSYFNIYIFFIKLNFHKRNIWQENSLLLLNEFLTQGSLIFEMNLYSRSSNNDFKESKRILYKQNQMFMIVFGIYLQERLDKDVILD